METVGQVHVGGEHDIILDKDCFVSAQRQTGRGRDPVPDHDFWFEFLFSGPWFAVGPQWEARKT